MTPRRIAAKLYYLPTFLAIFGALIVTLAILDYAFFKAGYILLFWIFLGVLVLFVLGLAAAIYFAVATKMVFDNSGIHLIRRKKTLKEIEWKDICSICPDYSLRLRRLRVVSWSGVSMVIVRNDTTIIALKEGLAFLDWDKEDVGVFGFKKNSRMDYKEFEKAVIEKHGKYHFEYAESRIDLLSWGDNYCIIKSDVNSNQNFEFVRYHSPEELLKERHLLLNDAWYSM